MRARKSMPAPTLALILALALTPALPVGCAGPAGDAPPEPEPEPKPASEPAADPAPRKEWALAIHGGAGTVPRDIEAERRIGYEDSLRAALRVGADLLDGGSDALDAVEATIRAMEDDPRFNAGRGAVFNREGRNELDASIMDGRNLACGAVAGVRTVRHPISLARAVMERTRHVLLAGDGAEAFADVAGVERVDPSFFRTEERWERLQRMLEREEGEAGKAGSASGAADPDEGRRGTVGVVALDRGGNLAAGTSTGGLTGKRWGRVGDSPIVGAGTYADNRTCAVSATGVGEEFIRHGVARAIAARMEFAGQTVAEAAQAVVGTVLREGDGGVIALDARGEIAFAFNTTGMYRGAADSTGRFDVAIWEPAP